MKKVETKYKSGKLKEIYFLNDDNECHGYYLEYTEKGFIKMNCVYKNGSHHNIYFYFNKIGEILFIDTNKNSKNHGIDIIFNYEKI